MSTLIESATIEPHALGQASFLRRLLRRPVAIGALLYLALVVVACITASVIAPYNPQSQDLTRVLTGPTSHNLLGTDQLGRDVLSGLLYGGRRTLLSVVEGVSVALAVGVPLGLASGYAGGWADRLGNRLADIMLAIPSLILVLVVLAILSGSEDAAMITFGILYAPRIFRVVRAAALRVREDLYIAAARISGLSHPRIVLRHVLPRVAGPIAVQASLVAASTLLFETGLAFLGVTGDITNPSWGGMVEEGSTVILQQRWLIFPSGAIIALTVLAFGLFGDALRDTVVRDEAVDGRRRRISRPKGVTVSSSDVSAPSELSLADGKRLSPEARSAADGALLDVRNLSVALEGRHADTLVVESVSFSVSAGETVGLIGESGCGKTVTALSILRLLPSALHVIEGQIYLSGHDLRLKSEREFDKLRGSTLAFVSQEPQASLDPTFTIGSQLVEVIKSHERCSRKVAKLRALELLGQVELPDPDRIARSRAYELSGGMAQRVAIALALAGRPQLLIADEPTTALDVTVQEEIMALLRRLQRDTGMAILLITHNWGLIADICDRTFVMYAGQVVEQASAQEMFEHPLHPYTLGLLQSHPSLAQGDADLVAMPGGVPPPGSWPSSCRFAPRCRFAADECLRAPIRLTEFADDRQSRCVRVDEIFMSVHA